MSRKKENVREKQIGIHELVMLITRSRIPWILVAATFVFNLYYNRILFSLPISTSKLLGGDLSSEALKETLLYYGAYALCVVIQSLVLAFTNSITTRRARYQLWGRMLKINEAYFDQEDGSVMLSAVTYDISNAMPTLVNLIVAVVPDLIYVFKALKMIDSYDSLLLLVVILFLPVKYIYMLVIGRRVYATEAAVREKMGVLTGKVEERLANTLLIKSFNKEEQESAVGADYIDQLYKADVAVAKLGGISLSLEQGIELAQQFIVMVIAVMLLQKGKIEVSEWIAFFLFFTNLSSKFGALIQDWMNMKTITGSLQRTTDLYHAPMEERNENGSILSGADNYDISLFDVSFRYTDDLALSHVSFYIPQGQKVAIVGSCGSGKSTTLALLERFYEPEEGTVSLGGRPVSEYQLENYRSQFAYVPQNHSVFTGTIKETLLYGNKKTITEKEILAAAKSTGFDQYLSLQENGLASTVKNGGEMMSGGQLQKLILTREKLRDSRIVLMDEPVSALDAKSTADIKNLILQGFADKTVICVTHDLSFIDAMDQIILLDNGALIDKGNYNELLTRCEKFRELVQRQNGEVAI